MARGLPGQPEEGRREAFAQPAHTPLLKGTKPSSRILGLTTALGAAQSGFDQNAKKIGVGDAGVLKHFRVHTDGREAGNRVYFVDVDLPGGRLHQEIDARQAFAAKSVEAGNR